MTSEEPDPSEALGGGEIRKRVVAGAAAIGARGVAINILAFVGNVALARLLVPADFGTVAMGLALLTLMTLVADGGLGAGLIRRPQPPSAEDLRALLGVQLVLSCLIAGVSVAVSLRLGRTADVVALILAALPVTALRGPAIVRLQRQLTFGPQAAVEVTEVFAYYAWGIATVALGFGVWGLASASIVKALTGTAVLLRMAPDGLVRPLTRPSYIRPMLRFGVRFQAVQVIGSIRDQGASIGTAAVAGAATLALWTIAWRLMQVPFLLFQTLWRVSFPAMAQLEAAGEDPRPIIERVVRLAAAGTGVILTALAASSPSLIPALFGRVYADAADAVPPVCLALQISGPVSVAAAGYLFASGQVGVVLRASVLQVFIWFGIAFPLLPFVGVGAVGIGFSAAALTETVIFTRAVRRATGARLVPGLVVPFAAAAAASGCGWLLATVMGPTLPGAIASAAVGVALYALAMLVAERALVAELSRFVRRGAASLVPSS